MLVYDIEIRKAILGEGEYPIPGVEYCGGWDDKAGMGVAVVCAYDVIQDRYRVFTSEEGLGEFQYLSFHRDLVGFNSMSFDDQVLKAAGFEVQTQWDLSRAVKFAAGHDNAKDVYVPGFSLDALAKANGLEGKSGDGARAPVNWQRGRYGEVIDYCLQDVKLTWELTQKVIMQGALRDPRNSTKWLNIAPLPLFGRHNLIEWR